MTLDSLKLPAWCVPAPLPLADASGWLLTGDTWAPVITAALDAAEHSIELAHYSVTTKWRQRATDTGNIWRVLLAAPARGVRCRALLAQHPPSARSRYYNDRAARALETAGWTVRRSKPAHLLHMKLTLIDGCAVSFGSHNLSMNASADNIELSALLHSPEVVQPFSRLLESLWVHHGLA